MTDIKPGMRITDPSSRKSMDNKQAQTTYMDNPDRCPYCRSNLYGGDEEMETRQRTHHTHCNRCGAEFTETFTLSGVTVDKIPSLMPFRFFNPPWSAPLEHEKGDLVGRRLWFDLTNLREALTEAGVTWLTDGACDKPQKKRVGSLWRGDDNVVPQAILIDTSHIFIACSDDGDPCEIWVVTANANLIEIEEILDEAMENTGSTMVVCFNRDGTRYTKLDME